MFSRTEQSWGQRGGGGDGPMGDVPFGVSPNIIKRIKTCACLHVDVPFLVLHSYTHPLMSPY